MDKVTPMQVKKWNKKLNLKYQAYVSKKQQRSKIYDESDNESYSNYTAEDMGESSIDSPRR